MKKRRLFSQVSVMKEKITIKNILPGARENVPLAGLTSFKIGGKARYFFVANDRENLMKAIKTAKNFDLPFFVLAGGSNLLVPDKGFNGLIIKNLNTKYYILNTKIRVEAGVSLGELVGISSEKSLTGLEWAVGIPGTVGGAIFGNAGSFKKSMKDAVEEVEFLDADDLKVKKYNKKKCEFSYRESVFKRNKNLIIISATLSLKKGDRKEIKKRMEGFIDYKKKTQPLDFPSAGSVFKNPAPEQSAGRGGPQKFSAAELIEKCGLKGKKIGGAMISQKHANFIVNFKKAKSRDVIFLIKLTKKKVKEKFKVDLEKEIDIIPPKFKNL